MSPERRVGIVSAVMVATQVAVCTVLSRTGGGLTPAEAALILGFTAGSIAVILGTVILVTRRRP